MGGESREPYFRPKLVYRYNQQHHAAGIAHAIEYPGFHYISHRATILYTPTELKQDENIRVRIFPPFGGIRRGLLSSPLFFPREGSGVSSGNHPSDGTTVNLTAFKGYAIRFQDKFRMTG